MALPDKLRQFVTPTTAMTTGGCPAKRQTSHALYRSKPFPFRTFPALQCGADDGLGASNKKKLKFQYINEKNVFAVAKIKQREGEDWRTELKRWGILRNDFSIKDKGRTGVMSRYHHGMYAQTIYRESWACGCGVRQGKSGCWQLR